MNDSQQDFWASSPEAYGLQDVQPVDPSNDDIVGMLKQDGALSAKLLRVCNSAAFGFEQRVVSVDQAVLLLGHEQVLRIAADLAHSKSRNPSNSGARGSF